MKRASIEHRFVLVVVYDDATIDVFGHHQEGPAREVLDAIIEEPEGIGAVSLFERGTLVAGMRFEWKDGDGRALH